MADFKLTDLVVRVDQDKLVIPDFQRGWLAYYNEPRTHQGPWCYGDTPMQTYIDTLLMAKD